VISDVTRVGEWSGEPAHRDRSNDLADDLGRLKTVVEAGAR
jgi:hypothetical protein